MLDYYLVSMMINDYRNRYPNISMSPLGKNAKVDLDKGYNKQLRKTLGLKVLTQLLVGIRQQQQQVQVQQATQNRCPVVVVAD